MNFAGETGGKASESAVLKSICLKKMSQKRGYMDGIHKKMIEKTGKSVILLRGWFW